MNTVKQSLPSAETKIADLTVGEFQALIRETIEAAVKPMIDRAVFELEQQFPDPDEGKEFTPEFAEGLRQAISKHNELVPTGDVDDGN